MVAHRAGDEELYRLAQSVREVGTLAASRRRNSAEGSAARIQLRIAGRMESGDGRSVEFNFAYNRFLLK